MRSVSVVHQETFYIDPHSERGQVRKCTHSVSNLARSPEYVLWPSTKVDMVTKVPWRFPTQSLRGAETQVGLHIRCPLLFVFDENWNMTTDSIKTLQYEILWKFVGPFSSCLVRTDRRTDRANLIGAPRGCERAWKGWIFWFVALYSLHLRIIFGATWDHLFRQCLRVTIYWLFILIRADCWMKLQQFSALSGQYKTEVVSIAMRLSLCLCESYGTTKPLLTTLNKLLGMCINCSWSSYFFTLKLSNRSRHIPGMQLATI
jgi:hypothetical protein